MFKLLVALIVFGYIFSKLFSRPQNKRSRLRNDPIPFRKPGNRNSQITEVPVPGVETEHTSESVPHDRRSHLATKNEQRFHSLLLDILPPDCMVHSQVSLMALVTPVNFRDNSKTWAKRMDFVITDRNTRVLAVIELDDFSHSRKKRIKRDQYVNSVLNGHHPLIRVTSQKHFKADEIVAQIEDVAGIKCRIPACT